MSLEELDRGGEALKGLPLSGVMVVDTGRLTSSSVGASWESLAFQVPSHSDPDTEPKWFPLMRPDTFGTVTGAVKWVLWLGTSTCVGESEGVTIALNGVANPSLFLPGDTEEVLSPFRGCCTVPTRLSSSSPFE
jgi:hypothetical protein